MCLSESRATSVEKDEAYVRNSSFLSRDIEAQKKDTFTAKINSSPKKTITSPKNDIKNIQNTIIQTNTSPPRSLVSPPKRVVSDFPKKDITDKQSAILSPPKNKIAPPPRTDSSASSKTPVITTNATRDHLQSLNKDININNTSKNDIITLSTNKVVSPPKFDSLTSFSKGVTSNINKFNKVEGPADEDPGKGKKNLIVTKEVPIKTEKLSLPASNENTDVNLNSNESSLTKANKEEKGDCEKVEENNGVGDKIRKFEKAAEDASASVGRLSRPGSVRGRGRSDRLGSDNKEEFPPPITPVKDQVFFDSVNSDKSDINTINHKNSTLERQHSIKALSIAAKWQRNESNSIEDKVQKPEPQKIIKPEFKPMPSPVDLTIRSPSLGSKIPDQFPSQGTAFRNVASPDSARSNANKPNDDLTAFKLKNKQKMCVSKGTSYFSSVSDGVWLVKKNAIEEIEDRVLGSFRRAGGNVYNRSETMRPSSDSGQGASFTHATMGRNKRQMYTRSESLDPQWATARAQTLKRQSSIACTCGHDKKTKGKSADANPRPRSRSHEDDKNHVLDKYETLV